MTNELQKQVETHEAVISAQKRLDTATVKRDTIQRKLDELLLQRAKASISGQSAADLLYGSTSGTTEADDVNEKISRAYHQLDTWERVVKLGHSELFQAKTNALSELYQQAMPEYRKLITAYLEALAKAAEIVETIVDFATAYQAQPYIYGGVNLTRALYAESGLHVFCRNLIDQKILTVNDIPQKLRKSWQL